VAPRTVDGGEAALAEEEAVLSGSVTVSASFSVLVGAFAWRPNGDLKFKPATNFHAGKQASNMPLLNDSHLASFPRLTVSKILYT